ncbi:MAG: hypothetical protein ABIA74_05060 [bacterium]
MKKIKFFLISLIILFLIIKLFSYQMQEKYLVSAGLGNLSHENNSFGYESNVVFIKDLPQFAAQVVNNPRPVIVKIISNKTLNSEMKPVYQSLADQLSDVIFFGAINTDLSHQLKLMLQKILGFDEAQLPLIVFFKNGQMILPAFSGTATKENLFKLITTRFGKKLVRVDRQTLEKIKNGQNSVNQKMEVVEQEEIILQGKPFEMKEEKPQEPKQESFWGKIKSFF